MNNRLAWNKHSSLSRTLLNNGRKSFGILAQEVVYAETKYYKIGPVGSYDNLRAVLKNECYLRYGAIS